MLVKKYLHKKNTTVFICRNTAAKNGKTKKDMPWSLPACPEKFGNKKTERSRTYTLRPDQEPALKNTRKRPARCVDTIQPDIFHLIQRKQLFYLVGFRVYLLKYNGCKSSSAYKSTNYNIAQKNLFSSSYNIFLRFFNITGIKR